MANHGAKSAKTMKNAKKTTGKKNGRPKGARYSETQLGVVEKARKDGLGWRSIPKKHPGFDLTPEGVKSALRKLKKSNGALARAAGSGRYLHPWREIHEGI